MSNGDNFASGFITGAVLGGILGGVLGATLVSRSGQGKDSEKETATNGNGRKGRRWIRASQNRDLSTTTPFSSEERIEEARNSLEDKIAQLNMAIDEARQQLNDTAPLGNPSNSEPPQNHQASS